MNMERPMTAKAVAELLGVSTKTITNLCKSDDNPLPHILVGNQYRIFLSDVVAYFDIPESKLATQGPATNSLNTIFDGVSHHE